MKSVGQKIKQLQGLVGTADVTEWEEGFIENISTSTRDGHETVHLTPGQVEKIDQIYNKHFA